MDFKLHNECRNLRLSSMKMQMVSLKKYVSKNREWNFGGTFLRRSV